MTMDYLIWWMTLLLIGSCQISGNKEMLDVLVIYRTQLKSVTPEIYGNIKEYHRWGNAKEMLLKNDDDFIDSVEGMVPLNCAPATASCQWKLSGSWKITALNTNVEENFAIDIGNEVEQEKNRCWKRNCDVIVIENGRPKCSCTNATKPQQFRSGEHFPVSPGYAVIRTPTALRLTENSGSGSWFIVPPKNTKTFMSVSATAYYRGYNVAVKEVQGQNQKRLILHLHGSSSRSTQLESNHLLEVTRSIGGQVSIDISFKREHLELNENHGSLSYDIFPVSDRICVSVIFTTPESKGGINLSIMFPNETKYEVSNYTERQFGEWKMRTFKASLGKITNDKINLQLDVSGKGTILHSIYGCTPFGQRDITIVEEDVSIPEPITQLHNFKDSSGKCLNGGVYSTEAEKCVCPEGFRGESCEDGCGPYFYGRNCSSECSNFATGCQRIMFCKKNMSCRCAPGFQGKFCEEECEPGYYGASCTQKCGHCKEDSCDKFTGYCHYGCEAGFARPFCQIPYKYSKISPTVTYQDMNVVTIEINTEEVEGLGEREYYQIQYKEDKHMVWTELQPQKLRENLITTNLSGLLPGVSYRVRVVYIDKDGNSYQQSEVPTTLFSSLCTVPTSENYHLTATSKSSEIRLNWKYVTNKTDCPITGHTVVLQRTWNKIQVNISRYESLTFGMLMPGVSYDVKIKAITAFGDAPFSRPLTVKTSDEAPLHVSDLQVTERDSRKLRVSWKPPRFTGGSLQNFLVRYQCRRLLACEAGGACEEDVKEISIPGNQNYADLEDLQPHAQYFIEVAARSGVPGPYTSIEAVTQEDVPVAAPEMSESPIVSSTNVTIDVQWLPLKSCNFLNGYLLGYGYILYSENRTVLANGNTTDTHIAFDDLTPQASYFIHVHVISTGGWNTDKELVINASTAATVPEKVQNLSIYKRGRRVIGVRWAQPIHSYGELESFSISYCKSSDCKNAITERLPPVPCVPWPALFCHTISSLSPNTQYSVSVMARNTLVSEYGEAATVNALTSEGVPEAPASLFVSARTSDSVTLEWEPPLMFNGILRSFLINVEQLDSANSSNCCVYSPLLEIPVKSEERKYKYEVTDLIPASKYIISVSAKTISIGPSAFLTLSTSPETPELTQAPKLLESNRVKLPLGEGFPGINGTYLLLVLLPTGNSTSLIWNSEVGEKLSSLVPTRSFYIVEEYNAEVLMSSLEEEMEFLEVQIGKGMGPRNGTIGVLEDPVLPSNFRVGLALVLDYNGAVSVGFTLAEEVKKSDTELEDDVA